ncbi:MAG: aspartate aminotransferase family protein [Pseudomonadota bacterium]
MSIEQLLAKRERLLGPNNPLFYEEPLHLVKGEGVWVTDADGRRYLDCYNNVPCVGHCHPRVVDAISRQAAQLNTHTRYLHENILNYAEKLLATFDDSLDRMMLGCTGSEANDIALRMAKLWTGGEGIICTNATYHGNTELVMRLSSLFGPPDDPTGTIEMVPWPDSYRTLNGLEGEALADAYVAEVGQAIDRFRQAGVRLAGMLVCPIYANEGLPNMPEGYLERAVALVRDAGGVFIADEVQSGFGRTGRLWGHEGQGVVPDILTLGKPMANGHPVSAVVARGELIDHFRSNVMYFNTFGGNPVSCAAAMAVLEVIEDEGLVANAEVVGRHVLEGFNALKARHELVGDVRGKGLFFGVDLVLDRERKTPAPAETARVVNEMRRRGVIMSSIGEHGNVLKMRPPLPFSTANADQLISTLDDVLGDF